MIYKWLNEKDLKKQFPDIYSFGIVNSLKYGDGKFKCIFLKDETQSKGIFTKEKLIEYLKNKKIDKKIDNNYFKFRIQKTESQIKKMSNYLFTGLEKRDILVAKKLSKDEWKEISFKNNFLFTILE